MKKKIKKYKFIKMQRLKYEINHRNQLKLIDYYLINSKYYDNRKNIF